MSGLPGTENIKGGHFNFRVKIVQTDLTCGDYLFNSLGEIFGGSRSESPIVYQNSSYISKLYSINNFSGGILKKDRIEDIPERYRRFIQFDNPSQAAQIKSFKKELIMLANREEVGQNVFYNRLSNPQILTEPTGNSFEPESINANGQSPSARSLDKPDDFEKFEGFESLSSVLFDEFDGEEYDEDDYEYEEYPDYEDNEEIKDILHLNNYYNSEMYKMSKIEYDFSTSGNISLMDDGSLDIKYDESEVTGLEGSYIQLLFRPEEKYIVTVRRKNFSDSWFTLEKGKRISIEKPGFGNYSAMVLTTHAKELVNNMSLDGGDMQIVYVTETNGVPSEMILQSISAERVKE